MRRKMIKVVGFLAATAVTFGLFGGLSSPAGATVYGGPTGFASNYVACNTTNHTIRIVTQSHGTRNYSNSTQYAVAERVWIYSYSTGKWDHGNYWNVIPQGTSANKMGLEDYTFNVSSGRYIFYFDWAFQLSDGSWDYKAEYANSDNRSPNAQYGNYVQNGSKSLSCFA